MPPERSGIADYSALLVPALRERVDVEVARRDGTRETATSRSTTSATTPEVHGWILERLRRASGRRRPARLRAAPPRRGADARPQEPERLPRALERDAGVAGRLLGLGVIDGCVPPLWDVRPAGLPALRRGARPRDRRSSSTRSYVEERVRERGYDGPLWRDPDGRVAVAARGAVADVEGAPLFGAFGHMNASKRVPQLLRAFARYRADASGRAARARRFGRPGARARRGGSNRRASRTRSCARTTSRRSGCGRCSGASTRPSRCARRRWARRRRS